MAAADAELISRLQGRFDDMILFGPVPDGIRMDGHFSSPITAGALAGAQLTGVDYFRVRFDGVGVVDAREVIALDGRLVSVEVKGYILPPEGLPRPSAEQVMAPDFACPDLPFEIRAFAWFQTAAPALAYLNTAVVSHTGSVNLARGTVTVDARRVTPAMRAEAEDAATTA